MPTSLISTLNSGAFVRTDTLFNQVYREATKVYKASEGYFDCTVAPLVNAWGFGFANKEKMDRAKVNQLLPLVGFSKINLINDSLILPEGMLLGFNAIAQGYSVDLIAAFLRSKGDSNFLIEVGGELLASGTNADDKLWRIGVDKPKEEIDINERFQFILDLENKALATSGNYRKFYEEEGVKYAHTINPFTGFPAQNSLLSVTVIHDKCVLADAFATAFMVMGLKSTKQFVKSYPEVEVYLVYTDAKGNWRTYVSPEMRARIRN